MGMDQSLYLGVSIEIEYKMVEETETQMVCEKNDHPGGYPQGFCQQCGSMIVEKEISVKEPLTFGEMFTAGEDYNSILPVEEDDFYAFEADEYEGAWLMINRTSGKYNKDLDDEYGFVDIPDAVNDLISEFELEYDDLLCALKEHCKSVKVQYGLIRYYY